MLMTQFPTATIIQCVFMFVAGLAWATLPSETIPSIEWRVHFGIAQMCFGAMFGLGLRQLLARGLNQQRRKPE